MNDLASGQTVGVGEFKNSIPGSNMTMSSKWTSDNIIQTEMTMDNKYLPGSTVSLVSKFDPKGGNVAGGVNIEYKNEYLQSNVELSLTGDGKPQVSPSLVVT